MQREIFIDTSKCMDDITSWYAVAKELKTCINFIHEAIERKSTILVHCDLGVSTSYCVVLAYMMTKRRLRMKDSIAHLQTKRVQLKLNSVTKQGLEGMERSLDARKLRRLEDRLRKAPVMAIKF